MKNTILIVITTILFTISSYSQITLEKTIEQNERINFVKIDDETKYFIFDLDTLVMNIYNSDHSIYKTITVNMADLGFTYDINDFYIEDFFPIISLSKNVFDSDSELEFLLFLYGNNNTKVLIINEDGSILFSTDNKRPHFSESYNPQNPTWIENTNDGIKMILRDENSSDGKKYIYSLPGNEILSSSKFEQNNLQINAYPNPSSDFINLEYKLPEGVVNGNVIVYDLNGRKLKQYKVDDHVSSLKISTQDLSSGTYIYSVSAENFKSKPMKIIVK